jgi:signal transduction histidine kinase
MENPYLIENQRLIGELDLKNRQLNAVHKISRSLFTITDINDLLPLILKAALDVLNASAGSLLIHDKETDELVFVHVIGDATDSLIGMAMPSHKGIAGQVFHSKKASIFDNVSIEANYAKDVSDKIHYPTINMITVPLLTTNNCLGVIQVLNKRNSNFDDSDLEVLDILASQSAMQIEHANLEKEARLASIVKLIGDISHDLKNLLTPVTSGALTLEMFFNNFTLDFEKFMETISNSQIPTDLIKKKFNRLAKFVPEAIALICEGSDNVQGRAKEIADAIKGETAKPAYELGNIKELVYSVARTLDVVATRASVVIDISGVTDVGEIVIDKKLIHTATYNLVNNAIPEIKNGGTIYIRTSIITEGNFPDGKCVILEVEDTGGGMPENVRKRLFTKDAISTKAGGTGLGTMIIKKAVDAHLGTITVHSEQGVGSKFTVHIPTDLTPNIG